MIKKYSKKDGRLVEVVNRFSKKAIIFSFVFVVFYTILCSVFVAVQIPLNDTLTDNVYRFFGVEICATGFIKISENIADKLAKKGEKHED